MSQVKSYKIYLRAMENRSSSTVHCFRNNSKIVSPDKFHAIILNEKRKFYVIHS